MVDRTGNVVNNYQYDEWGNITTNKETVSNPFKYAGEVYDQETGLYYLRARYYDPQLGRFLNEDSVEGQVDNPLTLNVYTYCINNPLIYSDPSGNVIKFASNCSGNGQQAILDCLQQMTDFELEVDNGGLVTLKSLPPKNVVYPNGDNLILNLISSNYTITLKYTDESTSDKCIAANKNNTKQGVGCGSTIYIDPYDAPDLYTQNSSSNTLSKTETPAFIALGHELIHAYHNINGGHISGYDLNTYKFDDVNKIFFWKTHNKGKK